MAKQIPTISKYMTPIPMTVATTTPLTEAIELMNAKRIRHIPVTKNEKIVGLISDRDMKSVMTFSGAQPEKILVGDVCNDDIYKTKPETPISEVAREMAAMKYGSALVMDNGKLVGIFTVTDACMALSDICEQRFHQ